jgi:hypothetical protein
MRIFIQKPKKTIGSIHNFMSFKDYVNNKPSTPMELVKKVKISENLQYHIDNKISLCENAFRVYSKSYFDLINEVRDLYENDLIKVNDEDAELLDTDIGSVVEVNGRVFHLDAPVVDKELISEGKKNKSGNKKGPLNKPMRTPGGPKKFKVFVKTSGGKVKTVRFGDSKASGLSIKNSSPARAKSFRARHKCSQKKDRTTPGYWSCNIARYAKSVGLKSSRPW